MQSFASVLPALEFHVDPRTVVDVEHNASVVMEVWDAARRQTLVYGPSPMDTLAVRGRTFPLRPPLSLREIQTQLCEEMDAIKATRRRLASLEAFHRLPPPSKAALRRCQSAPNLLTATERRR